MVHDSPARPGTSEDEADSNEEVLLEHLAETMGDGVPALVTLVYGPLAFVGLRV